MSLRESIVATVLNDVQKGPAELLPIPPPSSFVLQQILSGEATENVVELIHDYLESIGKRVRASEIDLDEFIILKVGQLECLAFSTAF